MTYETEHHGIWWLADRSDVQLHGTLLISRENRVSLVLSGAFEGSDGKPPEGRRRILGSVGAGQDVTLDECYVLRPGVSFLGVSLMSPRQTWHVQAALIGAHVAANDAIAFRGCVVSVPSLTTWLIRAKALGKRSTDSWRSLMTLEKKVRSLPLWTADGVTLRPTLVTGSDQLTESVMKRECRLDLGLSADSAISSAELLRKTRPLQLLLSLSTGRPSWILPRTATLPSPDGPQFANWHWQPHGMEEVPLGIEHAFGYDEWRKLRRRNLKNWLGLTYKLAPVVDLYLAALREMGVAELRFLTLAQALESYHRRTHADTLIDPQEWKILRERLVGTVTRFAGARQRSKEWRQRVVQKFEHANELNLRSRLKQLLGECGGLAKRIAGTKPSEFAHRVAMTRNYLTHWSEDSRRATFQNAELTYACYRMLALLEILMLRDAGFDLSSQAIQITLRRRTEWLKPHG